MGVEFEHDSASAQPQVVSVEESEDSTKRAHITTQAFLDAVKEEGLEDVSSSIITVSFGPVDENVPHKEIQSQAGTLVISYPSTFSGSADLISEMGQQQELVEDALRTTRSIYPYY